MKKHINITLQFPSEDSPGLSLKKYMGSDIQLIITNLYKPNQYIILNRGNIKDFDEKKMRLTTQIPVDNDYTEGDYRTAGIRLIMNTPISPEHLSYVAAKKIVCNYYFYKGNSKQTNPITQIGEMYDSGNGSTIKWHFVIKTQTTDAITTKVTKKFEKKTYQIGYTVENQIKNLKEKEKEYRECEKKNYFLYAVTLTFRTPQKDYAGTGAIFSVSILDKTFYFDTKDSKGEETATFFPTEESGYNQNESIINNNTNLEKEGFKCKIYTREDDETWVTYRKDGKRFEQGITDRIVIILPLYKYPYNKFSESDISLQMTVEKDEDPGWEFEWCDVGLFKHYTKLNLKGNESIEDNKYYDNNCTYDKPYQSYRYYNKEDSEDVIFTKDKEKDRAIDMDNDNISDKVCLKTKRAFKPVDVQEEVRGVVQYSDLRETINKKQNPILKNYREEEGHSYGRSINDSNRKFYEDIFQNKVKSDLTIDEPQIKYRIEPYVRNVNEDNINNALSMAIHDPLWMLARQWQFGEFEGNDAGSAILAKLKAKKTKVNQLYNPEKSGEVINTKDLPLEPMVEALPIEIDWQARVESAHYFLSMLQFNTGIKTNLAKLKSELLNNFPLEDLSQQLTDDLSSEEKLEHLKTACKKDLFVYVDNYQNKIFDGYKLYLWCVNHITKSKKTSKKSLSKDDLAIVEMLKEYVVWFEKKYHLEPNKYWKPEALNYRFGVKATADATNLVADNYDSGKLSWFSFEAESEKKGKKISKEQLFNDNFDDLVAKLEHKKGVIGYYKFSTDDLIDVKIYDVLDSITKTNVFEKQTKEERTLNFYKRKSINNYIENLIRKSVPKRGNVDKVKITYTELAAYLKEIKERGVAEEMKQLGCIMEDLKHNQTTPSYSEKMFTFIPTMARYPGMPKKRLWELESGTVEMGVTTGVGVKHYANALILQYATMYSNDWMMLPMELDISTITEVDKVLLTNVFGDRTIVRAKDEGNTNERFMNNWAMFALSRKNPYLNNDFSSDRRMFYPPALYNGMESAPIEEIQFLRDEMSNMIWGVENIINQGCGIPLDGKHFAAALEEKIEEYIGQKTQNNSSSENKNTNKEKSPEYAYTFQNRVPANWIPFIPVRMEKGTENYEREIRLQRAKMPIFLANKYLAIQPNTSFLRAGLTKNEKYQPLFINEEEINAVGAKLIKTYQRTRWIGGKTFTWIGYKKQLSGTQANSGLKFDKLEELQKNEE